MAYLEFLNNLSSSDKRAIKIGLIIVLPLLWWFALCQPLKHKFIEQQSVLHGKQQLNLWLHQVSPSLTLSSPQNDPQILDASQLIPKITSIFKKHGIAHGIFKQQNNQLRIDFENVNANRLLAAIASCQQRFAIHLNTFQCIALPSNAGHVKAAVVLSQPKARLNLIH